MKQKNTKDAVVIYVCLGLLPFGKWMSIVLNKLKRNIHMDNYFMFGKIFYSPMNILFILIYIFRFDIPKRKLWNRQTERKAENNAETNILKHIVNPNGWFFQIFHLLSSLNLFSSNCLYYFLVSILSIFSWSLSRSEKTKIPKIFSKFFLLNKILLLVRWLSHSRFQFIRFFYFQN